MIMTICDNTTIISIFCFSVSYPKNAQCRHSAVFNSIIMFSYCLRLSDFGIRCLDLFSYFTCSNRMLALGLFQSGVIF